MVVPTSGLTKWIEENVKYWIQQADFSGKLYRDFDDYFKIYNGDLVAQIS